VKFLVATDIAARGLDVDGISHVINYDLPDSPDDYVHRIGRTARAGETGHAFSLFSPRDAAALSAIEKHLSQKIEKATMPEFNYEEELGVQHEVRQGHNVRDYDDLGRPGAGPSRPRPFKDEDERASITLLYAADQDPAQASAEAPEAAGGGDERRGGRRRGRGGRDRDRDRDAGPRSSQGAPRREGGGPGFGRQDRERRPAAASHGSANGRGDRHQANASLSATDVLRKASDQKAMVDNDMMDLRPRGEQAEEAPAERPAPVREARQDGERGEGLRADASTGGGKKRRRRRRGKGGLGGAEGARPAGQPQQASRDGQRRDGGRNESRNDGRNDGRRGGRDRDERRGPRQPVEAKPSLWQRLKSSLGLGSGGGGSLGDKW
jgi:superfamily II DNA/RNA helicase